MSILVSLWLSVTVILAATGAPAERTSASPAVQYSGMSDASAGVPLGANQFMAADDESNTFGVYRLDRAGPPVVSLRWDTQLGIASADKHPEADVEGATVRGDRVYWISSHGRNKDGKWRPNRHRFFAMTLTPGERGVAATPLGKPCRTLATELVRDRRMRELGLDRALGAQLDEVERLAPKEEGLNIEGLAAAPDSTSLWIAFRNPLCDGKALLVPLENPDAVLLSQVAPEFGDPVQLDLGVRREGGAIPLGFRSIEYSPRHAAYLIVAGPPDERKVFALYRWSGRPADQPALLEKATAAVAAIKDFTPEALLFYPQYGKIQLLSDDGTIRVKVQSPAECKQGAFQGGTCEAKDLLDGRRKTFKSVWVAVE